jgi:hypothetical protein
LAIRDPQATLPVGLDATPPAPIQMGSSESNDFRGYEVDLLHKIALANVVTPVLDAFMPTRQ